MIRLCCMKVLCREIEITFEIESWKRAAEWWIKRESGWIRRGSGFFARAFLGNAEIAEADLVLRGCSAVLRDGHGFSREIANRS